MKCANCGRDVPEGKKFCTGCGAPIGNKEAGGEIKTPAPPRQEPSENAPAPNQRTAPAQKPPRKTPKKKKQLTSNEIPGFEPPKPVIKDKKQSNSAGRVAALKRPDTKAVFSLLASPWKFIPPVDNKVPEKIKPFLTLAVFAVAAILLITAFIPDTKLKHSGSPSTGYLPPDVRLLDESLSDNQNGTRVEIFIEVGDSVQEANLRNMLSDMLKRQKEREGFNFNPHPTYVAISAYSSNTIFRNDRDWWIGRLVWVDGMEPELKLNMEALLPRNEAMGYGSMTREEYLRETDSIFKEVHSSMNVFNDLLKQYEKMVINDTKFLERGGELSDVIYENTKEIPGPPWNECAELASAFEAMIEATGYFEALFAPDTDLFSMTRFDSKEFSEHLNEYFQLAAVYSHERSKYRSSGPVRIQ